VNYARSARMNASMRTARRSPTIAKLTGDEPWSGYDELSAEAVGKAIGGGDKKSAKKVRAYERDHKDRSGVIEATDRRIDAK